MKLMGRIGIVLMIASAALAMLVGLGWTLGPLLLGAAMTLGGAAGVVLNQPDEMSGVQTRLDEVAYQVRRLRED